MKTHPNPNPIPHPQLRTGCVPTEAQVLEACREAAGAEADYATKAIIAGFHLLEFQTTLTPSSHSGKTGRFLEKSRETSFAPWLESNGVSKSSAYRWMAAAERVARVNLKLPMADDFSPVIEVDGAEISLSAAMTNPEQDLPAEALQFREGVFDFMANKSLAEAARAALEGESPAHRITRAANGKNEGGTRGEDRKAWHLFIGEKLSDITGHLGHWRTFTGPQKEITEDSFARAIEKWPTALLEQLARQIKAEMQRR